MKALLLKEPHVFEMIETEIPVPGPGQARVKVLSTGICGSEIAGYHGKHFGRVPPAVMGHEVCGIVDALGEGAAGPAVGTRVVAMPQRTCGECAWCRSGAANLCRNRLMLGFTAWPGSYAEYFVIPASLLYPVADQLTPQQATLVEPLAVGVHAVRRLGVRPGDSILVFGSGAIGLAAMLAARDAGAAIIMATDVFDYNLDIARAIGATHVHNARSGSVEEPARKATDGAGADHAILAAEAPGLVRQALHSLRIRGKLAIVASYAEDTPLPLQFFKTGEFTMLGSVTYDREDFGRAVELAEKNHSRLSRFISHDFPLEKAPQAFELAAQRSEDMVRIVFTL